MVKLVNAAEDTPDEFYIFVSKMNLTAQHNFQMTGSFVSSGVVAAASVPSFLPKYLDGSATYHPFGPCEHDCHFVSPYLSTAINDYRVEYDAERHRLMNHGKYPSRLSAVFAFGDMESCNTSGGEV